MATLEERVSHLEGRVDEQTHMMNGIREAVVAVEHRLQAFETRMDARFEAIDRRFEAIDRRFEAIDRRFGAVDQRFLGIDERLDGIDAKISRQFVWLVGVQVMTLAAVVTALATILGAIGAQ